MCCEYGTHERALEPVVRRYSEHFKVVVVTGPRQVGKTTTLRHLSEQDAQTGLQRNVGMGSMACMTSDTFPLCEDAWAFPAWAI